MTDRMLLAIAAGAIGLVLLGLLLLVIVQGRTLQALRLIAEQSRSGNDTAGETTRRHVTDSERAVLEGLGSLRTHQADKHGELHTLLAREQQHLRTALVEEREKSATHADGTRTLLDGRLRDLGTLQSEGTTRLATLLADEQLRLRRTLVEERERATQQSDATRTLLDTKLRELRDSNDAKLAQIEKTVNEQLHQAVEQQMTASFARVIDQFTAVQKAMGDVQAVTSQIGDIKRLFSNVKTRGGWGEAQVRAMLDDILPAGSYETNCKLRADSNDLVEFAVVMPMRGTGRIYLPVDAKFPVEDYERLLTAAEAGDAQAEKEARGALQRAIRVQARRIADKYICPPATVEFAVMYLPTDGLYAEVARIDGLIDALGREYHVLILGPSLFPALIRTIQLGQVTLQLEQKTDEIRKLLGATKAEMLKMDDVLERLEKQNHTVGDTIQKARVRTRAVGRKLRAIEAAEDATAELLEDDLLLPTSTLRIDPPAEPG